MANPAPVISPVGEAESDVRSEWPGSLATAAVSRDVAEPSSRHRRTIRVSGYVLAPRPPAVGRRHRHDDELASLLWPSPSTAPGGWPDRRRSSDGAAGSRCKPNLSIVRHARRRRGGTRFLEKKSPEPRGWPSTAGPAGAEDRRRVSPPAIRPANPLSDRPTGPDLSGGSR